MVAEVAVCVCETKALPAITFAPVGKAFGKFGTAGFAKTGLENSDAPITKLATVGIHLKELF